MTGALRELSFPYAVLSERRRYESAAAVHEPGPVSPPYRSASSPPAEPSARATLPRRSRESFTPPVRLHLKPGQKGTKQLLAQYGDRLICVRYRYDAQRKKRFKTVESSSPNVTGNRHRLASPTTRSSGCASPSPTRRCAPG